MGLGPIVGKAGGGVVVQVASVGGVPVSRSPVGRGVLGAIGTAAGGVRAVGVGAVATGAAFAAASATTATARLDHAAAHQSEHEGSNACEKPSHRELLCCLLQRKGFCKSCHREQGRLFATRASHPASS